jgi:eukaryotic-like serine/threonine-protein kinase
MNVVRTCPRGHQWEAMGGEPASCPRCAESSTLVYQEATDELEDRVAEAILSYQQAVEAGRRPDRVEFLRGHADLAEQLEPLVSAGQHADALLSPLQALAAKHGDRCDIPTPAGSRFRRLRLHDTGGQGEVFLAVDTELNREVALKEIQDCFADHTECRARFVREAEITGNLQHPGIVPVYGLGAYANGRPYYAMRFIEGDSLKEAIEHFHAPTRRGESSYPAGPVSPDFRSLAFRKLLDRFVAVCNAVAYAHSRGVLHRDLKPGNIMLGNYGETLVVDWGLAKAGVSDQGSAVRGEESTPPELQLRVASGSGNSDTQPGKEFGTIPYMSPEQAAGRLEQLGPPSDVYSLGATLYHLLTGEAAFAGRDRDAILAKVKAGEFTPPRRVQPTVPRPLEAICLKAMALHAADRYPSARELAEDVERWLADESVRAWPEPWTIKLGRWVRAHKPLVSGAAAAVFVAMIATTAGLLWYQQEQNRRANARDVAEASARLALDEAEQRRAELDAILQKPRGVFGLVNDPAGWQAKIEAARASLERARAVLAGADEGVDPELAERVAALHPLLDRDDADRVFALRLEKVRMDRATVLVSAAQVKRVRRTDQAAFFEDLFDTAKAAEDYPRIFGEAGIVVLEDEPTAIAARFRASPIREQLLAAIDDWSFVAAIVGKEGVPKALGQIRRLAAPAAWRDRLYQLALRRDWQGLDQLMNEVPDDRVSPAMLPIIGSIISEDHPLREHWLRRARAQNPGDFWLNLLLGNALRTANPVEAAGFYRVALAVRPTSSLVYANLGLALINQKQLPEAIAAYRKAIELDSQYSLAYNNLGGAVSYQKRLPEAIAAFRKAIEIDPKRAGAYYNLGCVLLDQRQLPEAVTAYRKAIEIDPKFAMSYCNLGIVLYEQNELSEAIIACRTAIKLRPKYAEAHNTLGLALRDQKQLPEAITAFRKAIDIDPRLAAAYKNLGVVLAKQKQLPEAVTAFRKGIDLDPKDAKVYYNLGLALYEQKELSEAIVGFRNSINLDPQWAPAHYNLGLALRVLKQLPEAIAAYRKAIKLDPKDARAWNNFGDALRELRELTEAIVAFDKAIEIDPKYALPHGGRGSALMAQGRFADAAIAIQHAFDLLPAKDSRRSVYLNQLKQCQQLQALAQRLPLVLEGKEPATPSELLQMAIICQQFQQRSAGAVRLYQDAFKAKPELAEDAVGQHRYNQPSQHDSSWSKPLSSRAVE